LTTGSGKLIGSLIVVGWIWAVCLVAMGVVWWLFGYDFILAWFPASVNPLGPPDQESNRLRMFAKLLVSSP
jgi:hypothetical protein